jgi:hypothetical protein
MTSTGKYFGGGCIGSFGSVRLNFAEVTGCSVTVGDNGYGRGGAIFATGDVHLVESVISYNTVRPGTTPYVCVYIPPPKGYEYCYGGDPRTPAGLMGGGVFAKGDVTLEESLITGNSADAGGGVFARGGQVLFSTLSSNEASTGAAMLVTGKSSLVLNSSTVTANQFPRHYSYCDYDYDCYRTRRSDAIVQTGSALESMATAGGGQPTRISNSTFANNSYTSSVIHSQNPLAIYNSTIALNRWLYYDTYTGPSGIAMDNASLTIASSIVSQNGAADVVLSGSATVTGSHNLIGTSASPMPPGTLSGCPMLKVLDDNGGLTLTLAVRPTSPAIGTGSNPSGLQFDQRGSGFMRAMGSGPDIGAIEAVDDRIFVDAFQLGAPPVCT